MLRRLTTVLTVALMFVFASGCGGDSDDNGDDASPTAEASAAMRTPGAGGDGPAVVQRVIAAATSGDPAQVEAIIDFQTAACTIATPTVQQSRPPVCRTAEADGTELEVILTAECESAYTPRDELILDEASSAAYSFFGAYEFLSFPAGAKYVVVFERPPTRMSSTNIAYVTNDDGVIAILYGCATTPEQFVEFAALGEPILSPD